MCLGRPSAPAPVQQVAAPVEVLHNPFLDDSASQSKLVKALRTGTGALRIKMPGESAIGFGVTATGAMSSGSVGNPSGNSAPRGAAPRGATAGRSNTEGTVGNLNQRALQIATPAYQRRQADRASDRADMLRDHREG